MQKGRLSLKNCQWLCLVERRALSLNTHECNTEFSSFPDLWRVTGGERPGERGGKWDS